MAVDPNILFRMILPDYLGAMQQGQGMRRQSQDHAFLQQQRQRQQGFRGAMDQQSPNFDITTPEGQAQLARALAGRGFGPEAFEMAGKIQRPKPEMETFSPQDTESGLMAFGNQGTVKPYQNNGQPIQSKKTADEVKHQAKLSTFRQDLERDFGPRASAFGTDVKKRNALIADIHKKYGDLPEAQKFVDDIKTQPTIPGMIYTPRQQFQDISSLRNDFETQPEVKALVIGSNKIRQMNALWSDYQKAKTTGKGAPQFSDQVFAVNFNKLIDETSAVMPGEFARTAEGAGLTDAMLAGIQQAVGGGLKFTDDQRAEMVRVANRIVELTKEGARPKYEQYRSEAQAMKFDPKRITGAYDQYFAPPKPDAAKAFVDSKGGKLPTVTTKAQRDSLPPGTRYIRDGKEYVKQ